MNLGKTILNVLINQPKVYVEGLGVFSRIYISSKYDERNKIYLPPISYIEFDGQSTEGFELTKYIQSLYHVDLDKAKELLSIEVDKVLNGILNQESVLLSGLGYLVKHGDRAVFKPLDLSGFNLEPISDITQNLEETVEDKFPLTEEEADLIEEIPAEESVRIEKENDGHEDKGQDEIIPLAEVDLVEEKEAEGQGEESETEIIASADEEQIVIEPEEKSTSNTIWYVLAALILFAVGGYFFYDYYTLNQEASVPEINKSIVEVTPDDSTQELFADSLSSDTVAAEGIQQDSIPEEVDPYENHKYQIVIGSHKTMEEAEKQAEEFHKAGHVSVRVIPSIMPNNRKKVIWDSYIKKSEVDSALRYVKKHFVKDAWPDQIVK